MAKVIRTANTKPPRLADLTVGTVVEIVSDPQFGHRRSSKDQQSSSLLIGQVGVVVYDEDLDDEDLEDDGTFAYDNGTRLQLLGQDRKVAPDKLQVLCLGIRVLTTGDQIEL